MCPLVILIILALNLDIVNSKVQPVKMENSTKLKPPCVGCASVRVRRGEKEEYLTRNSSAMLRIFERQQKYLHDLNDYYDIFFTIKNLTTDFSKLLNINTFGMTVTVITMGYESSKLDHLNPTRAEFYTNGYRWSINFLNTLQRSLLEGTPYAVHQRFLRESRFINTLLVPRNLQYLAPWIKARNWEEEAEILRKYNLELMNNDFLNTYWV